MSRSWAVLVVALIAGCPQRQVTAPVPVAPKPVAVTPPIAAGVLAPAQPTLRLPRNFVPTGYAVRLEIDPAKAGFEGAITIAGVIDQTSSVIWLHGRHLTIHRASATKGAQEIALAVTPKGDDLLEVRAARPLEAGEWSLLFDYAGELDAVNTTGAFKQVVDGNAYVYTQLEAVYARRVFPCFDEPDNKVPWKLTLDVPSKLVAVANTAVVAESAIAGGRKRVEFAPTKPLPSYLIAFGVGPFEIVDGGKTKSGTPVRIIALAHRATEAAFAAKTTAKILELTEDYFGIPYAFGKLDILTIPLTVGFGAMENAGLITFTETIVLLDKPSREREHDWIVVAAHEIAHQWFGDLVTMGYWDDIWLNEGFAQWLEHKTSAKFEPSWHDEQNALDARSYALGADSLISARQIRQPIQTTDDILNAFDSITYQKGASVLNMFEAYLGPEVFQRGVREYIRSRAGGNATSKDFVAALSAASGKDLAPAFGTFLDQAGTPELTTTLTCTGTPSLAIAQHRYVPPGAPTPPSTKPWIVPVCVAYEAGGKRAETCTLLDQPSATIALPAKACPRWVMPNVEGRGYYRTAYTTAQITALRDEAWDQLSWTERRALYLDLQTAASTGRLPLTLALSLVPKLLAGNDRFTVEPALGLPIGLEELVPDDLRAKYTWWLRETFGAGARRAGLIAQPTDTLDIETTRQALVHAVAWTGRDPELVDKAVELADKWRDLPEAMRGLVLAIAADAKPAVFDALRRDVMTEPDRARRQDMFAALGEVRDLARQSAALALILDPKLDIRETLDLLFDGSTEALRGNAQQFFREHKDAIIARLPLDEPTGSPAGISWLFTATCKAGQRDAIAQYVTATFAKMPGGARTVQQSIEGMDQCIARRALLEPEIRGWLSGIKIPKPTPASPKKPRHDPKEIKGAEKPHANHR